MLLILILS